MPDLEQLIREAQDQLVAAQFIGYYTLSGPNGFIESESSARVNELLEEMRKKHSTLRNGRVRRRWFSSMFRVTIWT